MTASFQDSHYEASPVLQHSEKRTPVDHRIIEEDPESRPYYKLPLWNAVQRIDRAVMAWRKSILYSTCTTLLANIITRYGSKTPLAQTFGLTREHYLAQG